MAGIDKITNEILQDARTQAESILADARQRAEAIVEEAVKEAASRKADAAVKSETAVAEYGKRILSQIDMQKRQAILAGKQEIIGDIIGRAQEKLQQQDDASWEDMILKLLQKAVQPGEGEILFSAADKKRVSAGLAELIGKAAAAKGGTLKVSDETADIRDGFILRYGGIEENCSLKALFEEKQEQLQDVVHQLLW